MSNHQNRQQQITDKVAQSVSASIERGLLLKRIHRLDAEVAALQAEDREQLRLPFVGDGLLDHPSSDPPTRARA